MDANINDGYLACRLYELDTYPLKYKRIVIDQTGGVVVLESSGVGYIAVSDGAICEVVTGQSGTKLPEVSEGTQDDIKIVIDGKQIFFSPADGYGMPFIESGRTMVPLRKLLEVIGADVSYDANTRTVIIKKGDTDISVLVGGEMLVNGSHYPVDAPAVIKDARVYVPIRHIFEALGYSLAWDQETRAITIK
jgi:hypothetical protein